MSVKFQNRPGNVLVYAVLTIAAILSSTIVVSNFVRSFVRQTGAVSNLTGAFYAAESGVERALFTVRKQDELPPVGDCLSGAECQLAVNDAAVLETKLDLPLNQSTQIDLFNPDKNSLSKGVESVGLSWAGGGWLELTFVEWSAQNSFDWQKWDETMAPKDLNVQKMLYSGGKATVNFPSAAKNYRLRVKALYAPAAGLTVRLFSADNLLGKALPIANTLELTATGTYRDATQKITATLPRYAPMSGLFDYVLFSEEKLVK